jgi:hypothetical protein
MSGGFTVGTEGGTRNLGQIVDSSDVAKDGLINTLKVLLVERWVGKGRC